MAEDEIPQIMQGISLNTTDLVKKEIKQEEYKIMNQKIEQALEELRYSKQSLEIACSELEKDYVSNVAKEKLNELIEESKNIDKVIKELTQILVASKAKMKLINVQEDSGVS